MDRVARHRLRVMHDRRHADPAFGGESFEHAKWCGTRARPVGAIPELRVRLAHVVEAIVAALRYSFAQRIPTDFEVCALGTVVRHEEDEGVVELPPTLERVEIGRFDFPAKRADIRVTEIIGYDQQNIGSVARHAFRRLVIGRRGARPEYEYAEQPTRG